MRDQNLDLIYDSQNIQLQSSRFRYIKSLENVVRLGLKVELFTRSLTIPELPFNRVKRLKLISSFHRSGLTDQQISDLFNNLGIRTPKGKFYTSSLVWVTRKKWNNRKLRELDTYSIIHPPKFYLVKKKRRKDDE